MLTNKGRIEFKRTAQIVLILAGAFVLIHADENTKCTKDSCEEDMASEHMNIVDNEREDLKYSKDNQQDFDDHEKKTGDCLAPDKEELKIEIIPDNDINTETLEHGQSDQENIKLNEASDKELLSVHKNDDYDKDNVVVEKDEISEVELVIDDNNDGDHDEDLGYEYEEGDYEFPVLSRVDPGTIGDEVQVELEEGVTYKRITRAIYPPVFEIPDFLSPEECDLIISSAEKNGLNMSNVFGEDVNQEFEDELPLAEISRVSEQTWLDATSLEEEFYRRLHRRVGRLTNVPVEVIERGEPMQVVSYVPGGHYHAHLDTIDADYDKPCCFQTRCGDREETPEWNQCCRLCRFITVLYYLNDPQEGGETAFPLADMPMETVDEKFVNLNDQEWYNLSYYCHNSSLVVKPKRGTAVMWYNHFVDNETGYLGKADRYSHHGGCDLKRGSKWIANNWISAPTKDFRFRKSVFFDG